MTSDLPELPCRSCGESRPLEEYRLFRDGLQMDFCVWCERAHGTLTLYRRFSSYGTQKITQEVFSAERTPPGRRSAEQVRLLIQPTAREEPKNKEELIARELQRRELCRRKLIYFTTTFDNSYLPGWVHQDISRRLERFMAAIERGESPRLAIFMPPRAGKSRLASDMFPSWVLGHHPEWPIIAASYGLDLPVGFSRLIRDRIKDPEYQAVFEGTRLRADTQGVENWMTTRNGGYLAAGVGVGITGKGFMCVVGSTRVLTEIGEVTIADLHHMQTPPRVASANPVTGAIEWKPIVASQESFRNDLVTVRASDGSKFTATSDHPVFVKGVGYVASALLAEGAPLSAIDLCDVRNANRSVFQGLPSVLSKSAKRARSTFVQLLPQRVRTAFVSAQQSFEEWAYSGLLLGRVLSCAPRREECEALSGLRSGDAEARRKVLFAGVPEKVSPCSTDGSFSARLRAVREIISAYKLSIRLLFEALFPRAAFAANAGQGQPSLCAWPELREVVRRIAQVGHEARQESLRRVSIKGQIAGTSYRREYGEQRRAQSRNVVPTASSGIPQQRSLEVASVTRVCSKGELVYDIQVEGNRNFFAEGVLVHNCGIIDDPIKDFEASQSETIRDSTWGWYQSVFRTRAAPGAGVLLIQTRWHDLDVAGRLLDMEKQQRDAGIPEEQIEHWEVVSYPALAEHDEYLLSTGEIWRGSPPEEEAQARLLRRAGDALHPERYSTNDLLKLKHGMSSAIWSALYQQNPTPDDGEYFKKSDFRYGVISAERAKGMVKFITVDYAIGKKQRNDWTVMGVHALMPNNERATLAIRRGRWQTFQIVQNAIELIKEWSPDLYAGEQGQLHAAIWPVIQAELDKAGLYISVNEDLTPVQDKETRARPLQALMQARKWVFAYAGEARSALVDEVERELLRFPNGTHDDIVDMLSWAARVSQVLTPNVEAQPPPTPSWRDELEQQVAGGDGTFMAA